MQQLRHCCIPPQSMWQARTARVSQQVLAALIKAVQKKIALLHAVLVAHLWQGRKRVQRLKSCLPRCHVSKLRDAGQDAGAKRLNLRAFTHNTKLDSVPVYLGQVPNGLVIRAQGCEPECLDH
eukprot:359987-Chlamydomonas_euryale.AAC.2